MRALAKLWGCHFKTLCRWSSVGKWPARRGQYWARVNEIEEAERARKVARIRSQIHSTNARVASKALKLIEECLDQNTPESLAKANKLAKLVPGIAPLARERRIAYALELPVGVDATRLSQDASSRPSVIGSLLGVPHPDVVDPGDANAGDDIRAADADDDADDVAPIDTGTPDAEPAE